MPDYDNEEFDKSVMYDQPYDSSKPKEVDEKFLVKSKGPKIKIVQIGEKSFEIPSQEYVQGLEEEIESLKRELRNIKLSIKNVNLHHSRIIEEINNTKKELENKLDVRE